MGASQAVAIRCFAVFLAPLASLSVGGCSYINAPRDLTLESTTHVTRPEWTPDQIMISFSSATNLHTLAYRYDADIESSAFGCDKPSKNLLISVGVYANGHMLTGNPHEAPIFLHKATGRYDYYIFIDTQRSDLHINGKVIPTIDLRAIPLIDICFVVRGTNEIYDYRSNIVRIPWQDISAALKSPAVVTRQRY